MVKCSLFVLFLALAGCALHRGQNPQESNTAFIAAIRDRLSQVRQMEPHKRVSIVLATKHEAASYIDANLQQSWGPDSSEDTSLAYAKLGLLPPGIDLRDNLLKFYASQAMAFYDSSANRIVLSMRNDDGSEIELGENEEKVIAHELVHAYQDDKFAVGDGLRARGNSDAALALRSVAEGDAVLSEYGYVFGRLDEEIPGYIEQILDAQAESSSASSLPMILSDKLRFQYFAGMRLVGLAFDNGGWPAVNRLYRSPPLSTEQILHPEKYFEVPDPPTRIEIKGLARLFPPPWRRIVNDTLGELSVRCLFNQFIGTDAAGFVAQGWDGDRFVAYRKGDDVAIVWATIWDSYADADKFFQQYHNILALKYGAPARAADSYVEQRGNMVLVVEGLGQQDMNRQIDSIWAEMVIREEVFQPPINSIPTAIH